ncbi:hypothetical protein RJT34_33178 [Clitoria ternatea]|uniref:Inhibitor I9 domain-containing protein n=1 Tax=Clitoria ternatea TaxID=43366 RepID=A0AAN9EZW4_CLITE
MVSSISHVLLSLLLCLLLQEPAQAIKQSYIAYLGSRSFGQNPSLVDLESVTNSHYDLLGSCVGSTEKAREAIFYSYRRYFNGFAAVLDEDEAAKVARHPNVVSIFPNKARKLDTTHSWDFIGLGKNGVYSHGSLWKKTLGENIIIGNIDTGKEASTISFNILFEPFLWYSFTQS